LAIRAIIIGRLVNRNRKKNKTVSSVIILGKNSYIGRYLSNYLECNGQTNLIALSSKDCDLLNYDDVANRFSVLTKNDSTIVFLSAINRSVDNSFQSFKKNTEMVKNFVDNAKLLNVRSIIYLSSVDVYGKNSDLPITENTSINPDTWYGLSKYVCEWILRESEGLNCPIAILRIPGIFGYSPGDKSVIGRMVSTIKSENRIYIHGDGQAMRDYVSIDDLSRLITELIPLKYNGVLNIATGQSRSVLEISLLISRILFLNYDMVHLSAGGGRDFDLSFDNRKIGEVLPDFIFEELTVGINSYLSSEK